MAMNPNHSPTSPGGKKPFSCAMPENPSDLELARRLSASLAAIGKLSQRSQDQVLIMTLEKLMGLDDRRLQLMIQFIDQIVETHDPDTIATFLRWRDHPVLDTILHLAAQLDEDSQYEILELAEELSG